MNLNGLQYVDLDFLDLSKEHRSFPQVIASTQLCKGDREEGLYMIFLSNKV